MRTLPCAVNSRRDSLGNYPRVAVDRAGELLGEMEQAKGTRGQLIGPSVTRGPTPSPQPKAPSRTLSDIGIYHDQSSRWQKLAAIPEADFEATFE
jgi:hypothetical protein